MINDAAGVTVVRVTVDSSKERAIIVDYQVEIYKFKECQYGLYYYYTAAENSISGATDKPNAPITTYSFLSTIN